jgi:hypothetical protein
MSHPHTPDYSHGPGHSRDADLARLAAGHETGWWDEHGQPAPWPEDFFDDDNSWQPTRSEDPIIPEPGQPPF